MNDSNNPEQPRRSDRSRSKHSGELTRRKPRLPTEDRLTRQALHYLDRYASSSANLRRVLERKVQRAAQAHDTDPAAYAALIDTVLEKCLRSGVVDDRRFAETKLASLRRKGYSTRRIASTLTTKGLERGLIETVLEDDPTDERQAARRYAERRRLGPYRPGGDAMPDRRKRDIATLCRAGYSFQIARAVIDNDDG